MAGDIMEETTKAKSRFSSLDVRAATTELKPSLVGAHLQNIYDMNARTYLLKFTKKDAKVLLLIESGVRIHSTRFDRENPNVLPSAFAGKLRKHLRERRLTKFEQLGFDRVVHFEFGHDTRPEQTFHLFLELYAMVRVISFVL
jgi:predicted ribosome quality control (RQC) complex YloA/Tae2 family protein